MLTICQRKGARSGMRASACAQVARVAARGAAMHQNACGRTLLKFHCAPPRRQEIAGLLDYPALPARRFDYISCGAISCGVAIGPPMFLPRRPNGWRPARRALNHVTLDDKYY